MLSRCAPAGATRSSDVMLRPARAALPSVTRARRAVAARAEQHATTRRAPAAPAARPAAPHEPPAVSLPARPPPPTPLPRAALLIPISGPPSSGPPEYVALPDPAYAPADVIGPPPADGYGGGHAGPFAFASDRDAVDEDELVMGRFEAREQATALSLARAELAELKAKRDAGLERRRLLLARVEELKAQRDEVVDVSRELLSRCRRLQGDIANTAGSVHERELAVAALRQHMLDLMASMQAAADAEKAAAALLGGAAKQPAGVAAGVGAASGPSLAAPPAAAPAPDRSLVAAAEAVAAAAVVAAAAATATPAAPAAIAAPAVTPVPAAIAAPAPRAGSARDEAGPSQPRSLGWPWSLLAPLGGSIARGAGFAPWSFGAKRPTARDLLRDLVDLSGQLAQRAARADTMRQQVIAAVTNAFAAPHLVRGAAPRSDARMEAREPSAAAGAAPAAAGETPVAGHISSR